MLEKVKQFVEESFKRGVNFHPGQLVHFDRTVHWLRVLKPDADEAMLIAAYAHDIARAFRDGDANATFRNKEFNDPEYLKEHQQQGAKIISDFLRNNNYPEDKVQLISEMVSHHEVGGDENSDLLMDADSLSFMENNVPLFIDKIEKLGKDKILSKISWMYNRISSERARELAKSFYDKAMEELAKY